MTAYLLKCTTACELLSKPPNLPAVVLTGVGGDIHSGRPYFNEKHDIVGASTLVKVCFARTGLNSGEEERFAISPFSSRAS